MAGKARVHELARELGVSSRQVLSKLQDMGEFVKSPSSTVEAAVARQLRDAITGRGPAVQPRRVQSRRTGNNPYSRPRPDPIAGNSTPPVPRPRPRVVMPEDMRAGTATDDSFAADLRRARAASSRPRPSSRRPEHRNPIVDVILDDGGTVSRSPGGSFPPVVHEWAQRWTEAWFEPSEVAQWLAAGVAANAVDQAAELRGQGYTPQTWPGRRRETTA